MSSDRGPGAGQHSAIVIDAHADTAQRLLEDGYDLGDPLNGGYFNLESARRGNLGAQFFAIWVNPARDEGNYAHRALELIDAVYRQAAKHPDKLRMAFSPEEIRAVHREHKLAVLIGIEGGEAIENSLALLRLYHRLGVRYMTLTWNHSNGWADSCADSEDGGVAHTGDGLSELGKAVVEEMNRLGMMVDISHVSDRTFYRSIAVSRAPVIASHSAARALTPCPRNLDDDMLRAMGQYGGIVMVNFYSRFLSDDYRRAEDAQEPEVRQALQQARDEARALGKPFSYGMEMQIRKAFAGALPRPPLSALVDHIDHIARIAGIDHVGLGSDFDGIPSTPQGMDSPADLPKIRRALLERGYTAVEIDMIFGGNFLQVFEKVQEVSRQLHSESRSSIGETPSDRTQTGESE